MDSKLLTPLIFLVAAGIIFWGGVWQQISALQSLSAQLSHADAVVKQVQGGNAERTQLVSTWQNLDSALKDRVNLGLPASSDFPNALLLLNDAAVNSGLLVENISVAQTPSTSAQTPASAAPNAPNPVVEPTPSILLTVNARGDYASMKAFTQSIQQEERIMDIQSIDISPYAVPATASGGQGALSAGQASKIFTLTAIVKVYYGQ